MFKHWFSFFNSYENLNKNYSYNYLWELNRGSDYIRIIGLCCANAVSFFIWLASVCRGTGACLPVCRVRPTEVFPAPGELWPEPGPGQTTGGLTLLWAGARKHKQTINPVYCLSHIQSSAQFNILIEDYYWFEFLPLFVFQYLLFLGITIND